MISGIRKKFCSCIDSSTSCSCVLLRAQDCNLCSWTKGSLQILKCQICWDEFHVHSLNNEQKNYEIESWKCTPCVEAETERLHSASLLLQLGSSSQSPNREQIEETNEPNTPPHKRSKLQFDEDIHSGSLFNIKKEWQDKKNNHLIPIKLPIPTISKHRPTEICTDVVQAYRNVISSPTESEALTSCGDPISPSGSCSDTSTISPISSPRISSDLVTSRLKFFQSLDNETPEEENLTCINSNWGFQNTSISTNKKKRVRSQRGSLDITCRRVVRALHNKMSEFDDEQDTSVAYKFQAAQLSDDIGEVRRRVYDVLPVLEAIGIVSRLGRLYVHHGLQRVGPTLHWVECAVKYAKDLADGKFVHDRHIARMSEVERVIEAGRFLKLIIENGPQYECGELVPLCPENIPKIKEMARRQSNVNGELKTLGIITIHMLVLMFVEGPTEAMSMSSLSEKIQRDPSRILLKNPPVTYNNPIWSNDIQNRTKSGSGRRLYDVVSVLTGVGLVSTRLICKQQVEFSIRSNGYKSKCVRINPAVFSKSSTLYELLGSKQVEDVE